MKVINLLLLAIAIITVRAEEDNKDEEKYPFQAEVSRLLDIIINSLYTQKEIFLREAISNASDALDKLRFLSVEKPELLEGEPDLKIKISVDTSTDDKKLIIEDTGVGMTKQDLINNLGTIARSGTTQFLDIISKGGNLNLIGQFGVGFYSYFLVANKITVITKHNDDDQYVWISSAGSDFVIRKEVMDPELKRGTKIILHLKLDATEFTDVEKIKSLIKKYSEFINFPINLYASKEVSKEVEEEEEEQKLEEEKKDEEKPEGETDIKVEDEAAEKPEKKKKVVKETVWDWEVVNDTKALWLRSPEEIEDEEYKKFYKSISKDHDDPLTWIHFKAEGDIDFTALLFIPKRAPHDMFQNYNDKKSALKLYVRRVLINEEFDDLLPKFLSFVKGVVDSDDLPLNVSREALQQMRIIKTIKKKLVKSVLNKLDKMAQGKGEDNMETPEDDLSEEEKKEFEEKKLQRVQDIKDKYIGFWNEFGKNIKLGMIDDQANRSKLAKISRFYTSYNNTNLYSLDEYISRKKEAQDSIYYIAGDKKDELMKSPISKGLIKRNYEVLLLIDPIDEYVMQNLSEYEKNKLVNISKGDFKFPEDEDEKRISKKLTKYYQPLIDWLKKLLEKNVETVRVSLKMEKDPLVVLAGAHGYSAQMEKVARAQALGAGDKLAFLDAMKKIVEINPYHPFIKELLERVKTNLDKETEDQAKVLFSVALVNSGYSISDITEFSDTFYGIMSDSMGISREAGNVEIDIDNEVEDDPIPEENNKNDNKEEENKSETTEDPVNINYDMGENPEVVNTENVSHEL